MKKIFAVVMTIMMVSSAAVARRLAPEVAANAKVVKSGSTFTVSYVRAEESSVKVSIYNEDNKKSIQRNHSQDQQLQQDHIISLTFLKASTRSKSPTAVLRSVKPLNIATIQNAQINM